MGLLSSIFSTGEKVALARDWAKERSRRDLGPVAAEFLPLIDKLSALQVMGLPEYSIITIVETFADLTRKKVPPGEILARIEAHRSSFSGGVRLPERAELEVYVFDRMSLEHPTAELDREWTDLLVSRCRERFRLEPRPDLSWMDAPMITRRQPAPAVVDWEAKYKALHGVLMDHWNGITTEQEFWTAIEPYLEEGP